MRSAQAGFQLPTLHREGYRFEWISPWKNETVRQVVQKMLPGTIGVGAIALGGMVLRRRRAANVA